MNMEIISMIFTFLIMIFLLFIMKRTSSNVKNEKTIKINNKKLNQYILPNNRGRDIDEVFENISNRNIKFEFHLDEEK